MTFKVLFSDLDGTLVHYPKEFEEYAEVLDENETSARIRYRESGEERVCVPLTSMTGGKSYISQKTIDLVAELRGLGVLFVIITGARSSTYEKRRDFLPKADYEFFENGSRMIADGKVESAWTEGFAKEVGDYDLSEIVPTTLPEAAERKGSLWTLFRELAAQGWKLDGRDYFANFRVDVAKSEGKTHEDFVAVAQKLPGLGLKSSFNLGKADIYPAGSGKANAAQHILNIKKLDSSEAVAMFDDDNDVELGQLCGKAYLPGITHPSVAKAVEEHLHWEVTKNRGFLGTEEGLEAILRTCRQTSTV